MLKCTYIGKEGFTGPQGPSGLPGERGKQNDHLYRKYIFTYKYIRCNCVFFLLCNWL